MALPEVSPEGERQVQACVPAEGEAALVQVCSAAQGAPAPAGSEQVFPVPVLFAEPVFPVQVCFALESDALAQVLLAPV